MRLVPNPAEDQVTAYIDLGQGVEGAVLVEVQDAVGRTVQRRSVLLAPEQSSIVLDVSGLFSGTYTVAINHASSARVLRAQLVKR